MACEWGRTIASGLRPRRPPPGFVFVDAERRAGASGIEPELGEERRGAALRLVDQGGEQVGRLDGQSAPPPGPGLRPIKGAAGTRGVRFGHDIVSSPLTPRTPPAGRVPRLEFPRWAWQ